MEEKILTEELIESLDIQQRAWDAYWCALEIYRYDKRPQLCLPPHKEEIK